MSNAIADTYIPDKPFFRRRELAEILDCPVQTLGLMAMQRRGPTFLKLGTAVRYPRAAILAWMQDNTVTPKK